MRATRTAVVVAILLLVGARAQAQSLEAAKDLYASAEYDRALVMLDALKLMEHPREEQQAIELHRVLCLVATGKEADARGIIEGLVTRDPLYRPSTDLPPRVRSTYSETRKKMLPTAAQSAYQEAKAAFDFKDYSTAERLRRSQSRMSFRNRLSFPSCHRRHRHRAPRRCIARTT